MSGEILLKIESVGRTYLDIDESSVEALWDIHLSVRHGEFTFIIGPSDCGKTTLLRLTAGLDFPESGEITLEGEPMTGLSPDREYVFRQGSLLPWLTITQNIAPGLKVRNTYQAYEEEVPQFTELIGLNGFEKAYPHQISGGVARRVAIARAFINHPTVLLLGEPMGALDASARADLQDKLLEFWKNNETTIILVARGVDEALYLSDRIVIMTPRPGKIGEILEVPLPRPRLRNNHDFAAMHGSILEKLHLASVVPQSEYTI